MKHTAETVMVEDDRPPEAADGAGPAEADSPSLPPLGEAEVDLVEVAEIAEALRVIGETAHAAAGHPEIPDHWAFTDREIDQLAPPVTALVNRHAGARALAQRSPELAVTLVLGRWTVRNVRLSAAIREAAAELEAQDRETGEAPVEPPAAE